jgi:hypothetical protein
MGHASTRIGGRPSSPAEDSAGMLRVELDERESIVEREAIIDR